MSEIYGKFSFFLLNLLCVLIFSALFLVLSLKSEKKMDKNRNCLKNKKQQLFPQTLTFNYKTGAAWDLSFYLSWHL